MKHQKESCSPQPRSVHTATLLAIAFGTAAVAREIGGKIWDIAKPLFDHGRAEIAAALFSGHAHVMYMKGEGVEKAPQQMMDESKQQDRGGRDV